MKSKKFVLIVFAQALVLIYALSTVFSKLASQHDFLSFDYIKYLLIEFILLGIYAIFWQQLIKKLDLSIAYANRAFAIVWSVLIAFVFFKENVSIFNIIGALLIVLGIWMVSKDD